jgi:hypothetical protein
MIVRRRSLPSDPETALRRIDGAGFLPATSAGSHSDAALPL